MNFLATKPSKIPSRVPPMLISCLASINKKSALQFSFFEHATSEPVLYSHSALISSACIFPLCCVFSVVWLMFWCSTGEGFLCFKAPKKGHIFASVVSKGSQPSKYPTSPKADSVCQKLHPGCRDCTNPCSCTVLTNKTTFKTLLVIKKETIVSLFLRIKKIAENPTLLSTV